MNKKEAQKELDRILSLLEKGEWLSERTREELEQRQRELLEIINQN